MKRFEKFTHGLFRSLIKLLKKYKASREPEMLHQIRVNIKKIKATLAVINESKKGFKAHKNFIPIRDIFRSAGAIREPDVLMQLLLKYEVSGLDDETVNKIAPDNEQSLAADFESEVPIFVKSVKKLGKKIEADSETVHKDDLHRYIGTKKKDIKSRLYPRSKMADLHKARKAIKEVVYLSNADGMLKKKEEKFYDKLQNAIGEFHDKQVLLAILKKKNADTVRDRYSAIKSQCLNDKKQINQLVKDFYG